MPKEKITPKNYKKGELSDKRKRDVKEWVVFTFIYVPVIAIMIGTTEYYFPDPIPILWVLYIDLAKAMTMVSIPLYLLVIGLIFHY